MVIAIMKIIPEIIGLAREHHQSLLLANKCINAEKSKQAEEIAGLCQQITETFSRDFLRHFDVEEQFVFNLLNDTPLYSKVSQLKKEHKILLNLAKELQQKPSLLSEFGLLLKNHTRMEDREVFPFLTEFLTMQQLQDIKNQYKFL